MADVLTFGASARMLGTWNETPAMDRQRKQTYPLTRMAGPGYARLGGGWCTDLSATARTTPRRGTR